LKLKGKGLIVADVSAVQNFWNELKGVLWQTESDLPTYPLAIE
jgi:hypothetical protein